MNKIYTHLFLFFYFVFPTFLISQITNIDSFKGLKARETRYEYFWIGGGWDTTTIITKFQVDCDKPVVSYKTHTNSRSEDINPTIKDTFVYFNNGTPLFHTNLKWDENAEKWKEQYRYAYKYLGNQLSMRTLLKAPNNFNGSNWIGFKREKLLYDNKGNVKTLETYFFQNENPILAQKTNFISDSLTIIEQYNDTILLQIDSLKTEFYNNGLIKSKNNLYIPLRSRYIKDSFVYDLNRNLILKLSIPSNELATFLYTKVVYKEHNKMGKPKISENFSVDYLNNNRNDSLKYELTSINEYTYDQDSILKEISYEYLGSGDPLVPYTLHKYEYCPQTPISTSSKELENIDITVFPNPTEGVVTINPNTTFTNNEYKLIDIRGVILNQNVLYGNGTTQLDLHNHPNGLYFLKIQSGDKIVVKKIVIQR